MWIELMRGFGREETNGGTARSGFGKGFAALAFGAALALSACGEDGATASQAASADGAGAAGLEDITAEGFEVGREGDIVLGSPDAPIKMIEYASMTCPACAAFSIRTFPEIKRKYIDTGLIQFTLREYPTAPQALSTMAFMVARCTGEERYYPAVKALFQTQPVWAGQRNADAAMTELAKVARQFGMSQEAFDECTSDDAAYDRILNVASEAEKEFLISGTPTFIVNGRNLTVRSFAIEEFDRLLKAYLPEGAEVPGDEPATEPEDEADDTGDGAEGGQ